MVFSLDRAWTVFMRYFYSNRRTASVFVDYLYWPVIDILLFGYIGLSLSDQVLNNNLVINLLTGMVLWQVTFRTNLEVSKNLLLELWDENLINFFATPLRLSEWLVGLMMIGPVTVLFTVPYGALIVKLMVNENIFTMGWSMLLIIASLVMSGWFLGIFTSSFLIYYGQKMDTLVWAVGWLPAPFCSIYYPLETLPHWMQLASKLLPMTYAFEAMRTVINTHTIPYDLLLISFALNVLYLILALAFFMCMFRKSKNEGLSV
jgi:ABC-2 type transport system permease protein